MKNTVKIVSILLSLVFLVCTFSACGEEGGDTSKTDTSTTSQSSREYNYGPVDYGEFPYADKKLDPDKPIRILCVNTERHPFGVQQFEYIPEKEGNAVNGAVQNRNNKLLEDYGIAFEVASDTYPTDQLKILIQSGVDEYDVVCESVDRLVTGVTENLYWSLDGVIDFGQPWWDKDAIEALSLSDKHFFLTGAAILTDDDNTYLTLYNKDMYGKNSAASAHGNIYDIVRAGDFTIDLYYEMCKAASMPDSNGQWGINATFGNLSHSYGATVMMNGLGYATVAKNEMGELYLNVDSEAAITAFGKVYDLMSDLQNTQRAELIIGKSPTTKSTYGFAELEEMFINGKGLFYNTTSSSVSILKSANMDFEFGVLPIPKLEKGDATGYNCTVNRYQSSALAVPSTVSASRLEEVAFALNALGFFNADVIRAYYQTTLQLQAVRSDDDAEMLDIIYNSRFYDIGAIFGWGNVHSLYSNVIADSSANTLVSKWESIRDAVQTDMEATLEAYEKSLN